MEPTARHPGSGDARPAFLRLSVTDRCNLRCRYCMPATAVRAAAPPELASLATLAAGAEWLATHCGVTRVKLTGGEPLARPGLADLVRRLATVPGVEELSATTNGTLLAPLAGELAAAGLGRVNLSLDTLDAQRFHELTRGGRLADALAGLDAALAAGLTPVKLNAVLLAGSWRQDVPALLDLAAERGLELRFIELMRTGTEAAWSSCHQVAAATVRRWLMGGTDEIGALPATGAARRELVTWRGRAVQVGWITPMSHPFCATCNRLRLDARGRLRRCLMDPDALPLVDLVAAGDDQLTLARVAAFLAAKQPPPEMVSALPMVAVGG